MNRLLILLSFVFITTADAQKVTVSGRISNLNAVNDTDFILYFKQAGKVVDSTLTHTSGYYTTQISPGKYDIVVTRQTCHPQTFSGITLTSLSNNINLSLRFNKEPVCRDPYVKRYTDIHSKSDTLYLEGASVHGGGERAALKKASSMACYASSGTIKKGKKHKKKKSKKRKYAYKSRSKSSAAKKTGIRSSTSTAPYAAGTSTTRGGIVGRGSRTDGYSSAEAPAISEVSDKDIGDPFRPGQVTAGHWRDLDHWKEWLKTNNNNSVAGHMKVWGLYPRTLNSIRILNQNQQILPFAKVKLMNGSEVVWETVTDVEGKAYLWPMVDKDSVVTDPKDLEVQYAGNTYTVLDYKTTYPDNNIRIQANKTQSPKIEIGFMVDATGSMGDEIKFLQRELIDVISRIKKDRPCAEIYTGSVFYKDHGDEYLTRIQPMTLNPVNTIDFISNQSAGGGGDFPEAVDYGLEASINQLNWSEAAGTKILFILLDAPPHVNPEIQARLNKAIRLAASKGIRLVPVAASGINQATEFLLKYMAILSNGEYLYITDDSNIGGRHLLPTGGKSDVEFLNDLMVNLILRYSDNTCQPEQQTVKKDSVITIIDSLQIREQVKQNQQNEIILGNNWNMRFYPNPSTDIVYFDFSEKINSLSIYSLSGQLMYENKAITEKQISIDLSQYSSGLYSVHVYRHGELVSGKLLVMH